MSNTLGSNAASEINPGELTLFIKDSVRGGCVFSLNHHLTWHKSFMEPHINHTPVIPSQGSCTGHSMGSWWELDPELSPPKAASPLCGMGAASHGLSQGAPCRADSRTPSPFSQPCFLPENTTPPLCLVFTQHCYEEQQPAPSLSQSDLAPAGSGTLLPSRHSPPSVPKPQQLFPL